MKRIRSTNDRLVDVIVFDPPKNIKLQPVTPLMPLEALLIQVNLTDSDSDGINGGTGCNFIFFFKEQKQDCNRFWSKFRSRSIILLLNNRTFCP